MRDKKRQRYWATGPSTITEERFEYGYYIEWNVNTGLFRINHPNGVPRNMMGSTYHYKALLSKLRRIL